VPYVRNIPEYRLRLGHLPTPLYRLTPPPPSSPSSTVNSSILQKLAAQNTNLYIKRDDATGGIETGGNKIRKLEFLLADALRTNATGGVVTIGGEQSNHCRATAAACRMVGLRPHLILRTGRADKIDYSEEGMGTVGNLLFDRMVGGKIYTCTPGEYGRIGSDQLVARLCRVLREEEQQAGGESSSYYPIPVGGSNGLGTFGYLDASQEILEQWRQIPSENYDQSENSGKSLDHIVVACGSGGTAGGIAIGMALAHLNNQSTPPPTVHAVGVCDSPDYFYRHIAGIAREMGLVLPPGGDDDGDGDDANEDRLESFLRKHMVVHSGKGLGYARSTDEELSFISDFAVETGVVLDPVYSGKAMYHFFHKVLSSSDDGDNGESFRDKNILFVHTGGALGMFDKVGESCGGGGAENLLEERLRHIGPARRLDVYGKGLVGAVDISNDVSTN